MTCVQALSDASHAGALPSPELLQLEAKSLDELTQCRQALLDALHAHAKLHGGS